MATTILEIMSSTRKHKEQVTALTDMAIKDKKVLAQLFGVLKTGTEVEKGTVAEVMKFISKECPDKLIPYVDLLIEYIDYKAPRVRWGCPEALGNIASKYPDKVEKAVPKLLGNLKDKSTVVRWCAAYALAEIAKYNRKKQEELVPIFNRLIKTEQNNGVRNVYIKALKEIDKQ